MTTMGWGAGRTCVDDPLRCRRCCCHRCRDRHLPTADGAACNDDYYYDDDDCRGEDPPDDGRRTTSHSDCGGCRHHPPRAGCSAPVAVFAVAVHDGPPVAVGRAVAIAVRRPLLLLLLHRCRRCRRLTIDAGNAIAEREGGFYLVSRFACARRKRDDFFFLPNGLEIPVKNYEGTGNYDYDRELSSIDTVPTYILSKFYMFGQGKCQLSVFFSMQKIYHVLRKTTCTISGS
jgi:hypothetical protein